jgi:hypothetical protein
VVWIAFEGGLSERFGVPAQLVGLAASLIAMVVGSLAPQVYTERRRHESHSDISSPVRAPRLGLTLTSDRRIGRSRRSASSVQHGAACPHQRLRLRPVAPCTLVVALLNLPGLGLDRRSNRSECCGVGGWHGQANAFGPAQGHAPGRRASRCWHMSLRPHELCGHPAWSGRRSTLLVFMGMAGGWFRRLCCARPPMGGANAPARNRSRGDAGRTAFA